MLSGQKACLRLYYGEFKLVKIIVSFKIKLSCFRWRAGGEGKKEGEGRGRRGRGVEETNGTYWPRDYLLIGCSEWIEGVDFIFLTKKPLLLIFHHFVILAV